MTVLLLFLMAYQVTGEVAHEYIGVAMTLTVIVHQILNRKWYGVLFKGRYNACRILSTTLTILLLISFAMTAFCGMAMSGYAVPFLYGMAPVHLARQIHLAMSHWSFVLMGLHLGVHVPAMIAGMKMNEKTKTVFRFLFACMAGFGLYLFLKAGMVEYMLFQVPFAFLDYEKSALQVFAENMVMLGGWVFLGAQAAALCQKKRGKIMPVLAAVVSIVLGLVLFLVSGGTSDAPQWTEPAETPEKTADTTVSPAQPAESSADDGFVSITGGTFEIGRAMENDAECIAYTTWGCVDVIAASTGQMSKRHVRPIPQGQFLLVPECNQNQRRRAVNHKPLFEKRKFTGLPFFIF